MLEIPSDRQKLLTFANDLIERCRASVGTRAQYYRSLNTVTETGMDDGQTKSRMNLMYHHLNRTSSHLFSPIQLQFVIDFEREYPKNVLERGASVGRVLTRDWERNSTDMCFGQGVFEALKYGACILKQWVEEETEDHVPVFRKKLVMPWQFAVYQEDSNDLNLQNAMVETSYLSLPQVWQRINRLPDAAKLLQRIKANSTRGQAPDDPSNFLNHILSTNQINTSGTIASSPIPGGVANFAGSNNFPLMGANVDVELVKHHEIWVKGEEDYVTIQLIEPDIFIMPYFHGNVVTRKTNALIPGKVNSMLHPYTLIQPSQVSGYFWGRSDLYDLIEPQFQISQTMNDTRRLFGVQVDKFIGLKGVDGLTDEIYDEMRSAGYLNLGEQGQATDLTPQFPAQTFEYIKVLLESFNLVGGFPPVMQGQGEAGVRAGVHADTLMKTGSPRLRHMSLQVERNCAEAADKTLSLKEAKDPSRYWVKGDTLDDIEKTSFLLTDLPEDRRVSVDSHSSSPIFADDHMQLVGFLAKVGWIGPEDAFNMLPLPNKELLISHYKERQKNKQEVMQKMLAEHPEIGDKLALKELSPGRR